MALYRLLSQYKFNDNECDDMRTKVDTDITIIAIRSPYWNKSSIITALAISLIEPFKELRHAQQQPESEPEISHFSTSYGDINLLCSVRCFPSLCQSVGSRSVGIFS